MFDHLFRTDICTMSETVPVKLRAARGRGKWTDFERRTVWWLICRARNNLQVEVDPVVATAFVILQRYFRGETDDEYQLFYLMAAALFTSCKAAENFRPGCDILRELKRCCLSSHSSLVRQMCCINEDCEFGLNDMHILNAAEMALLRAIDFDYSIEMPFEHFNRWKRSVILELPDVASVAMCNRVLVDICLIICSDYYLDVPPEVAAAAAAQEMFGNQPWIVDVQERYGDEVFQLALRSICFEKSRTARPPPQCLANNVQVRVNPVQVTMISA